MKKYILVLTPLIIALTIAIIVFWVLNKNIPSTVLLNNNEPTNVNISNQVSTRGANNNASRNLSAFVPPISSFDQRVALKPFGLYVLPGSSPVQPEKFTGYHTGVDFELLPDENANDVEVKSVCDGTFRLKQYVSGYGGVAVEECLFDNEPITVLYGHLKLTSIELAQGDHIVAGQKIGVLGKAYSQETDGERAHLHLGIHKGKSINFRGYVSNKSELSQWINALDILSK